MNKLLTGLAVGAVATLGMTAAKADIVGPNMSTDLVVSGLATSCTFLTPVDGSMAYDEPNEQFIATADPATLVINYRALTSLTVTNDGVFDSKAGAVTAIDYGTSTLGVVAITDNNDLTAEFTLTPSDTVVQETLTLNPATVDVALSQIDGSGAFPITFVITCIE